MIIALIKTGREKNILDSFEKEYIYFDCLKNFRTLKRDDEGRGDPKEGNLKNMQVKTLWIKVNGKSIPLHGVFKDFNAQFHEQAKVLQGNICSFSAISIDEESDESDLSFHPEVTAFGNKSLFVNDVPSFMKRLDQSIKEMGFGYSRKLINYYDPKTYDGDLTYFDKDHHYSYQKEYRVLIKSIGDQPLKVNVPGLKKWCKIIDSSGLIDIKKIQG